MATKSAFKGLRLADYPTDERSGDSSIIDLSRHRPLANTPPSGALSYIDRAFSVKGVGTVVLGFILGGKVSVHDKLRAVPSSSEKTVEVKGIQVNDEDYESAGAGIRVGLSLKGVDARDLDKASWLDDGSFKLTERPTFQFSRSPYYRQEVGGRDLHLQLPGELAIAKITDEGSGIFAAALPNPIPTWEGMKVVVVDLNGKNLKNRWRRDRQALTGDAYSCRRVSSSFLKLISRLLMRLSIESILTLIPVFIVFTSVLIALSSVFKLAELCALILQHLI